MNSEPPPPFRWIVKSLESFIDWIIFLIRQGKWSTILLTIGIIAFSLLAPDKGIIYQWVSGIFPKEQYFILFFSGLITLFLIAFVIRFLRLDKPVSRSFAKIMTFIVAIAFILATCTLFRPIDNSDPLENNFSWGEEFLTPQKSMCNASSAATIAFGLHDYNTAERYYKDYVKKCSYEPEAQIYLSNTVAIKTNNFTRVAVSVPISRKYKGVEHSEEILRGIALAQNEWNANKGNRQLVVGIANDGYAGNDICGQEGKSGECGKAKEIAKYLVKQSNILGVVGHFSSDATEAVSNDYKTGKLVVVSPTSTAVRDNAESCSQTDPNRNAICLNSYIFRTASNDSIAVKRLINFIIESKKNKSIKTVAIVYEQNSTYSRLFRKKFSDEFESQASKGSVINSKPDLENSCNFSMKIGFDSKKCLEDSKKANALLLVPSTKNIEQVKEVLHLNKSSVPNLTLLGADSMYDSQFIKENNKVKTEVDGMLLVVPWQRSDEKCEDTSSRLECKAAKLFGKSKVKISWRTATAFDAVQALSAGLAQTSDQKCRFNILNNDHCMRTKLKETLLQESFQTPGAIGAGIVKFDDQGDRVKDEKIAVIVEAHQGDFKIKS
jgi:branched-chain amino acid transport system substrate-binding protein